LSDRTATVYLVGGAANLPAVTGGRLRDSGGTVLSLKEYLERSSQFEAVNRAVATIHELLHFNFSDEALATANAAKNKKAATYRGLLAASNSWGEDLRQHCK
jgi:hypothetical protein